MAEQLVVPPYPAERSAKPSVVAVTGCTGFVASSLVQRLLALGHTVHGTCRDTAKASALQELPGAKERLRLFKADLLTPGAFDEAFAGCDYVAHCASPYIMGVPASQAVEKLIRPAVSGTENVLASVNKTPSVKRVVLTSSCAAVYGNPTERGPGHVFTEEDWCITPSETVLAYFCSKREAEKKAWEMVKQQNRWDLVVINPPQIFGPPLSGRSDGESIGMVRRMVGNEFWPACPKTSFATVDVRDVAAAHTLALFTPGAQGRYICLGSTDAVDLADVIRELAELYPGHVWAPRVTAPTTLVWLLAPLMGVSRDIVSNIMGMPSPCFSNDKIKRELGITFLPRKTTLRDQVERMKQLGLLPRLGMKGIKGRQQKRSVRR